MRDFLKEITDRSNADFPRRKYLAEWFCKYAEYREQSYNEKEFSEWVGPSPKYPRIKKLLWILRNPKSIFQKREEVEPFEEWFK